MRIRKSRLIIALGCLAVVAVAASPAFATRTEVAYRLSPTLRLRTVHLTKGPQEIRILRVAPGGVPDISPGGTAFPLRQKVSQLSVAVGAIAGVNGDFGTDSDQPKHTLMVDGELWTSGLVPGSAVAWSSDGTQAYLGKPDLRMSVSARRTPLFGIDSWNALQGPTAVSAYTARGGTLARTPGVSSPSPSDPHWCAARLEPVTDLGWNNTTHTAIVRRYKVTDQPESCPQTPLAIGSTPGAVVLAAGYVADTPNPVMGLTVGDRLKISWKLVGWPNTTDVMGGQQILVKDGVNVAPPYYSGADFILNNNPRTAVGITAGCSDQDPLTKCSMTLITVDGRQTSTGWSRGVRLPVLADEFLREGSYQALNMDGGGSTTMWVAQQDPAYCQIYPVVGGCVVNRPSTSSSGGERSIRSALVVLPGSDAGTPLGLG